MPTTVTAAVVLCMKRSMYDTVKQPLPHSSPLFSSPLLSSPAVRPAVFFIYFFYSILVLFTCLYLCPPFHPPKLSPFPFLSLLCFASPLVPVLDPPPPLLLNSDRLFISFCLAASPPTPLTRFALLFLHACMRTRTVRDRAFAHALQQIGVLEPSLGCVRL